MLFVILVLAVCLAFPAFAAKAESRKINVFVSILPQKYFVERIGGGYVDASVLVGGGQSHETYEPIPAQMSMLAKSQVYFTIGVPFENALVKRITGLFPSLDIINTSKGVRILYFAPRSGEQGPDPHIWLDPKRVRIIAENIASGLSQHDPAHSEIYKKNSAAFQNELNKLDSDITRILAPFKGRKITVFHPAFGYFCESYGLKQEAIEFEGKEPSAKQIARIIEFAKKEKVRVIFVQPQFSQKAARAIAQSIGGSVIELNPLPVNYLKDMKNMAETIKSSLAGRGNNYK